MSVLAQAGITLLVGCVVLFLGMLAVGARPALVSRLAWFPAGVRRRFRMPGSDALASLTSRGRTWPRGWEGGWDEGRGEAWMLLRFGPFAVLTSLVRIRVSSRISEPTTGYRSGTRSVFEVELSGRCVPDPPVIAATLAMMLSCYPHPWLALAVALGAAPWLVFSWLRAWSGVEQAFAQLETALDEPASH